MDSEEIEFFCKRTKREICFDSSHSKLYCNYAKKDFYKQTERLLPFIKHLQVADAKGVDVEGVQIDEGEIDFSKFFKLFKNYDGYVVNEVWQGFLDNFSGFKIAVDRIKKHIK